MKSPVMCTVHVNRFYLIAGHLYGLEKFWAFLKYSRREVPINWKIKSWLSKFMRLEDFRGTVNRVSLFVVFF